MLSIVYVLGAIRLLVACGYHGVCLRSLVCAFGPVYHLFSLYPRHRDTEDHRWDWPWNSLGARQLDKQLYRDTGLMECRIECLALVWSYRTHSSHHLAIKPVNHSIAPDNVSMSEMYNYLVWIAGRSRELYKWDCGRTKELLRNVLSHGCFWTGYRVWYNENKLVSYVMITAFNKPFLIAFLGHSGG